MYDAALEARPGRGNDVAYVISEWVDGEPLDAHLARVGALSPLDAADVLRQVADALTAAQPAAWCTAGCTRATSWSPPAAACA